MHLRRVIGLVTALSMSHLMVVGSDVPCATHAVHDGPVAVESMKHGDTGARDATHPAGVDEERDAPVPCDTPTRPDCCQAMTSCSTTMSAVIAPDASPVLSMDAGVLQLVTSAPASHNTAPEPPPPKL